MMEEGFNGRLSSVWDERHKQHLRHCGEGTRDRVQAVFPYSLYGLEKMSVC